MMALLGSQITNSGSQYFETDARCCSRHGFDVELLTFCGSEGLYRLLAGAASVNASGYREILEYMIDAMAFILS